MLTLEKATRELLRLPVLVRIGLLILAIGGLADVVAHLEATVETSASHEHGAAEVSAHLVGFVGMVVILLGVVLDGARRNSLGGSAGDPHTGGM